MNRKYATGGFPLLPLLFILFLGLKLGGVISWNWFWVVSPLLAPLCIVLAAFLFAAVLVAAETIIDRLRRVDQ